MFGYDDIRNLFGLDEPCGWSEEDISSLKAEYGSLPTALEDYYRLCAGCEELTQNPACDYLMPADKVGMKKAEGYYVFFSENQSVSFWGIKLSDMSQDDPPVYESYGDNKWYLTGGSLAKVLTAHAYLNAVGGVLEYAPDDGYLEADAEQTEKLKSMFTLIEAADSGIYMGAKFFKVNDDTFMAVMPNGDNSVIMLASASEEGFDSAAEAVYPVLGLEYDEENDDEEYC